MLELNLNSVSEDQILEKIKQEIIAIQDINYNDNYSQINMENAISEEKKELDFLFRDTYYYSDFLSFDDSEFIIILYRCILGRDADIEGYNFHLNLLRNGAITKIELINIISDSEEGKMKKVVLTDNVSAPPEEKPQKPSLKAKLQSFFKRF